MHGMFPALKKLMPDFSHLTLEHLATAVILLDEDSRVAYLNPAAEDLFDVSGKNLVGCPVQQVFTDTGQLANAMQHAVRDDASYIEYDLALGTHAHGKLHLRCAVTPVQFANGHGKGTMPDDGTRHARSPLPNPLPMPSPQSSDRTTSHSASPSRNDGQAAGYPASGRGGERERQSSIPAGEGANESLRELRYNQYLLLEFHPIGMPLKLAREEQMLDQTQANRLLLRNLAHEIKNPLGGIRGAAQLLDQELEKPALREYTQVIVQEADRLRSLMEKLLSPQNASHYSALNIHEVLERVRSVVLAEMPENLSIQRDYDVSLPALVGDKEQLIQAMLNIVRNAAQALQEHGAGGLITLRTRIARQVTLIKRRHRLAVMVQIIDNGPGIPPELQDKIFYPLVSGRTGGHGLGLTLAQDLISQHHGTIEFDSEPGRTCFTVLLPLQ